MEILRTYRNHQVLSDGRVCTEDGFSFPIHRFVLANRSEYFVALFCETGEKKREALIPGIRGEVLGNVLNYIYTGDLHVTAENIPDLIIAADYLLLEDLLSHMKTHVTKRLCVANSLDILISALKINSGDMLKESFRFVETHFEDIMRSRNRDFSELPLEALKQLLSDRNLRVKNENVVWLAIVEWVSLYFPASLPCVPDLLLCLAIAEVNESLANQILQHDFVAENKFCQSICDIKSSNPEFNNLQILQHYIQNSPKPNLSFYAYRSPTNLNFVAHYATNNGVKNTQIYVTYDEKLDLWRKVLDIDGMHSKLLVIMDIIYMFEEDKGRLHRYSITEKQWLQFRNFSRSRSDYTAVKLNGLIYILGGLSMADYEVFDVDIYDPEDDTWYDTAPMPPVFHFKAVTLNESIYVIGNSNYEIDMRGREEVIAVVYNSGTEIWNVLPRPSINRARFALAAYHEKLYVIGGTNLYHDDSLQNTKEVEVFDPANNIWSRAADLPYAYILTDVVVVNDLMIVFDNIPLDYMDRRIARPAVVWNVKDERWDTLEGFFSTVTFHKYYFSLLEEFEYVNVIAKENKDPEAVFEKSPFS